MSAPTLPRAARPAAGTRTDGPTFARVVASEWTKLTSLRSPWWTGAVTVVVGGVIAYLGATASSVDPGFQPASDLATGLLLAQIGPLVLGVLVGAGEFRTGAFRTTFTLVPRRTPVLAAQALVVTAFALVLGLLVLAAGVLGILPAARSRDLPLGLTEGETPGVMAGIVLLVVGLALLGFAIGALLRRTVPAMVTALVTTILAPAVLMMMGDPGADASGQALPHQQTVPGTLGTLVPGGAAQLLTLPDSFGPMPGAPDLGPVGGGLVLAAWVVLLLALAAVRLRARDPR